MIGNTITGLDVNGKECTGRVLDKVLTLQQISMRAPGDIAGRAQAIPMALDAYLVLDEQGGVRLVLPPTITTVITGDETEREKAAHPELPF